MVYGNKRYESAGQGIRLFFSAFHSGDASSIISYIHLIIKKLPLKIRFFACFLFIPLSSFAENTGSNLSFGSCFSPKGCGVMLNFSQQDSNFENIFLIRSDFYGVLTGKYRPGLMSEYFVDYYVNEWQGRDNLRFSIYFGPGLCAGILRDSNKRRGLTFGLAGHFGISMKFKTNVRIKVGFTSELAFHLRIRNQYDTKVSLYRNGIRLSPIPLLSIIYDIP